MYRLANQHRVEGLSLDQMLVSLYRANPDAFMGRNMNRLKAGAVLTLPAPGSQPEVAETEAREVINAHSADFGAYRSRLAASVPQQASGPGTSRQASGKVEARVQDRKVDTAPTPDQLKLSQGGVKAASSPEATLSRNAAAREAAQREAELARNVEALRQLQQMAGKGAPGAAAAAVAGPGTSSAGADASAGVGVASALSASASGLSPGAAPAAGLAASGAAAAQAVSSPSSPMSAAAPVLAAASAASAVGSSASAPASGAALHEQLLKSPLALPGAAALVLLLASLGAYRLVRRRRDELPETTFQASRFEGTAFGSMGPETRLPSGALDRAEPRLTGQDGRALSELGAMSDVDPVAEADVYLAYGRDRQAEEILREAMHAAPERLDIQIKLLEVLALRREVAPFESLARQVHPATGGQGPQWAQVASMGRTLDPDNPLYASALPDFDAVEQGLDDVTPPTPEPRPEPDLAPASFPAPEDQLSDLAPPSDELSPAASLEQAEAALGPAPQPVEADEFALDLGDDTPPGDDRLNDVVPDLSVEPGAEQDELPPELDLAEVDLTADDGLPRATPAGVAEPSQASASPEPEPLEPASESPPEDPLERKLALANEFLQIGDLDGARDLLDEVLAQTDDGPMKDRARELLDSLG